MTKPELPHYGNGVPAIVVQLKGKHCRKPHWRNGVVDMFGKSPTILCWQKKKRGLELHSTGYLTLKCDILNGPEG